jgi:hypothetical protein
MPTGARATAPALSNTIWVAERPDQVVVRTEHTGNGSHGVADTYVDRCERPVPVQKATLDSYEPSGGFYRRYLASKITERLAECASRKGCL